MLGGYVEDPEQRGPQSLARTSGGDVGGVAGDDERVEIMVSRDLGDESACSLRQVVSPVWLRDLVAKISALQDLLVAADPQSNLAHPK